MSSGVGERLHHAPPERSFQIAVDVAPERFEPRVPRLWYGPSEQLEEIGQGRRKLILIVGRQRHPVDIELRARQRLMVETGKSLS